MMQEKKFLLNEKLIREFIQILVEEKNENYDFIKNEIKAIVQISLILTGFILLLNPVSLTASGGILSIEIILASINVILDLTNHEYNKRKNKYEYSPELFDALINIGGVGVLKFLNILKNKNILNNIDFQNENKIKMYNIITNLINVSLISYDVVDLSNIFKKMYKEINEKYPDIKNDNEIKKTFEEYSQLINNASNTKKITNEELENIQYLKDELSLITNNLNLQEKVNQKYEIIIKKIKSKTINKKNEEDNSWDFSWLKKAFKPMKDKFNKTK